MLFATVVVSAGENTLPFVLWKEPHRDFCPRPAGSYTLERIDRNNVALLIIDHQVGLLNIVRDFSTGDFYRNIIQHASFGKTFDLPVVLTTSTETGM